MIQKVVLFAFILFLTNFCAQKNSEYTLISSPSFHDGFSIELHDGNILKFRTKNSYFLVDSLKMNNLNFPDSSSQDDYLFENEDVLTNSSFEKKLEKFQQDFLVEKFNKLDGLIEDADNEKKGSDGITFFISNHGKKSIRIWRPDISSEIGRTIFEMLDYIKLLFKPNSIIDKHIFETEFYIDESRVFNVVNKNPLLIRFYDLSFSFFYCERLKNELNKIPNSDLIYLDFCQVKGKLDNDTKECVIEEFNKKFKKIKIIQSDEIGNFNSIDKN